MKANKTLGSTAPNQIKSGIPISNPYRTMCHLEIQATRLSARLYSVLLREPLDSSRLPKLNLVAERAYNRSVRRHKKSLVIYHQVSWIED